MDGCTSFESPGVGRVEQTQKQVGQVSAKAWEHYHSKHLPWVMEAFRKGQTTQHLYKANAKVWIGCISKTMDLGTQGEQIHSFPNCHM